MISVITSFIGMLASIPVVGHYLALAMPYIMAVPMVASGISIMWHGLVVLLTGLGSVPGLAQLKDLADHIKANEQKVDDWESGFLLPLLDQLSAIPLPAANPPAPPAA